MRGRRNRFGAESPQGATPTCVLFSAIAAAALAACAPAYGDERLPVAVLGDSDSHSYRDRISGVRRGGAAHERAFNWIEIWERLRPAEIDPGPFVAAGDRSAVAAFKTMLARPTRVPYKEDYLYDYAWSGARCDSLNDGWPQQARWLTARLKAERARWRDGLVVIRIGVNDFGRSEHLARWSIEPEAATAPIEACLADIAEAVAAIRAASSVNIALIGIAHDYDAPDGAMLDPERIDAVAAALDRFDRGLARIAEADPRIAFVDDVRWRTQRFGSRRSGALAATASLAGFTLANDIGDEPNHIQLEDGHAGTVAGGLFLQQLVGALNARFGWSLTPIADAEIVGLVEE
jgi:hypothetical protein